MIRNIILAVLVAVVVTLGCTLVGGILISLEVDIAVTIGNFLKDYSGVIGVLSGLWYFFSGSETPLARR